MGKYFLRGGVGGVLFLQVPRETQEDTTLFYSYHLINPYNFISTLDKCSLSIGENILLVTLTLSFYLSAWFENFLYTSNEKTEREIQEIIPLTIATKRIKYLGVYLPKETKNLYI